MVGRAIGKGARGYSGRDLRGGERLQYLLAQPTGVDVPTRIDGQSLHPLHDSEAARRAGRTIAGGERLLPGCGDSAPGRLAQAQG